ICQIFLCELRGYEKKLTFEKCAPLFSITYGRKMSVFPIFSHVPRLCGEIFFGSGWATLCSSVVFIRLPVNEKEFGQFHVIRGKSSRCQFLCRTHRYF